MAGLKVVVFGTFEARLISGTAITLPRRKAEALLAYLALHPGQMQTRDKLATLLWGDASDERARHSLRQALVSLRRGFPRGSLVSLVEEGDTVGLDPAAVDVDGVTFEQLIAEGSPESLERAAALYRGDFLDGFHVVDAPSFEDWLRSERNRFRELAIEALARLLGHQARAGAVEDGVKTALRLLELDATQEPVHRALMRLYARQGRRGAALRQYQVCVDVLARELGLEPEAETRQLYRELLQVQPTVVPFASRFPPDVNVTTPEAPLVGRAVELAMVRA